PHAARLHDRDQDAQVVQLEATLDSVGYVHGYTYSGSVIPLSNNSISQPGRSPYPRLIGVGRMQPAMERAMIRPALTIAAIALELALNAADPASARDWPIKPVTLVIPFAAGSGSDIVGRILAPHMGELLGRPVIIENIGGAGGITGVARVARAA